jgi:acyl-ACP thioesterase
VPYTALAEPPGTGRAYSERVRAGIDTACPTGRVRLDAIARWLQDAAYWDLVDAGWERPSPWLVRRLRMRIERFPVFPETVSLTTWCSGLGTAVAERRTSVRGDAGARIEAVAQWVAIDPETERLAPLNEEFRTVFAPSAAGRRSRTKLYHEATPPAHAARRGFTFRAGDLDPARHVNNAAYWTVLEEELAELPPDTAVDVEIEHRSAVAARPIEVFSAGDARWLVADGTLVATFVLEFICA